MIKVFLDDMLLPNQIYHTSNDEWVVVKTVDEVKELLKAGGVSHLSLDNDLGPDQQEGYTIVNWMIENSIWPTEEVYIHSHNVVRKKYMIDSVKRYYYDGYKSELECSVKRG
jgi:hypothetical protein